MVHQQPRRDFNFVGYGNFSCSDPAMYSSVMDARGFSLEALMVALSHLFDNRAQDNGFVQMAQDTR